MEITIKRAENDLNITLLFYSDSLEISIDCLLTRSRL